MARQEPSIQRLSLGVTVEQRRAGRWPGRKARRDQWDFARRNWAGLAMVEVFLVLLVVGMLVAVEGEAIAFVAGFVACVGVVLPMYLVIEMTGTLPIAAGADAERMTPDGLRRLRRRGWLTFDHIPFANGDVDHAVVGAEEAYALETKWSASPWALDPPSERMPGALRSAQAGATKLERFLGSQTVGTPRGCPPRPRPLGAGAAWAARRAMRCGWSHGPPWS